MVIITIIIDNLRMIMIINNLITGMKTWRMLSSGIFLNLITLAVSIIIICHHQDDHYHCHDHYQDDQDDHDQNPHHLNLH